MGKLRIGTCSWKYDSWVGLVYQDKRVDYLKEYAIQYDTVEIDQWFWSLFDNGKPKLPEPGMAECYQYAVPAQFIFSVKIPNSITLTHYYARGSKMPLAANPHFLSPELFWEFLERIEPLGTNLGPLMFQFEYLNKKKMPSQEEFQEKLAAFFSRCPKNYDYAVEVRNPYYLNESYFKFLARFRLYHVFVQGYYMPSIVEIYQKYGHLLKGLVVIRLLGPDRQGIEERSGGQWNRIVDNRDNELIDIVKISQDLVERGIEVYVNVNNHYEGSSPLTIQKIRRLLANSTSNRQLNEGFRERVREIVKQSPTPG